MMGIWDTGAQASSISTKSAADLGLAATGKCTVSSAGIAYESSIYLVDILLPNGLIVNNVHVTEAKAIHDSDMLIGMDVIALGDLAITNANSQTFMSFRFPPGERHIDYVEQLRQAQNKDADRIDRAEYLKSVRHLKKKHKKK